MANSPSDSERVPCSWVRPWHLAVSWVFLSVLGIVLQLHSDGWPPWPSTVTTYIVYWSLWALAWVAGIGMSAAFAGSLTWARSYESCGWWAGARPVVGSMLLLLPTVLSRFVAERLDESSIRLVAHWLLIVSGPVLQAVFLLFLGRDVQVRLWKRYVLWFVVLATVSTLVIVLLFTFVITVLTVSSLVGKLGL